MAVNYSGLTGDQIVRKVRRRNRNTVWKCVLGIILAAAFLVGVIWLIRSEGRYFIGIIGFLIVLGVIYVLLQAIGKAMNVLKDVPFAPLFRKYGTPETIAMRIANGSDSPLIESRKTLIGSSFIMKHGDYESYIPFESVRLMYRKEHSTNGIKDSIFLVVYDEYGDSIDYPFKLGKKHADEMRIAAETIAKHAPECRFGYTRDNLNWIKSIAKKL